MGLRQNILNVVKSIVMLINNDEIEMETPESLHFRLEYSHCITSFLNRQKKTGMIE